MEGNINVISLVTVLDRHQERFKTLSFTPKLEKAICIPEKLKDNENQKIKERILRTVVLKKLYDCA